MKASVIAKHAQMGELKQLSLNKDEESLLSFINLGMIALYKRFNLSVKTEIVQTDPSINVYDLRNEDISQVLVIYNSTGEQLTYKRVLGDTLYDITQLTPTSFLFKQPKSEQLIFLYKANPPLIESLEDDVPLLYDMLEALLNYIGYKGQTTTNRSTNSQVPTIDFYKMYEKSCFDLEQQGFAIDLFSTDNSVYDKGFI